MTLHLPHLSSSNSFCQSCTSSKPKPTPIRMIPGRTKRLASITMFICVLVNTRVSKLIISICLIPSVSKSLLTVIGTLGKFSTARRFVFRFSAYCTARRFALVKAHGAQPCYVGYASQAQSRIARFGEEALTIPVRLTVAKM